MLYISRKMGPSWGIKPGAVGLQDLMVKSDGSHSEIYNPDSISRKGAMEQKAKWFFRLLV